MKKKRSWSEYRVLNKDGTLGEVLTKLGKLVEESFGTKVIQVKIIEVTHDNT
jgi:hypothetical protein